MIEVREVTDHAEWDDLLEHSEQGNIFSSTKWLKIFDKPFKIYGCYDNGLVGGIAGFEEHGAFISGNTLLTPYQGIIVRDIDCKYTRRMSWHNKIAEALLPLPYKKISICNHWTYPDIRPFLWAGWKPFIRYTYLLHPKWEDMEKDTRNEASRPIGLVWSGNDILHFEELYNAVRERKGIEMVPDDVIEHLLYGIPSNIYNAEKASAVIIEDNKRAYYILGASEGGSYNLLWDTFKCYPEIDLCGANVKEIGHYKKGFGGQLVPYYGVCIEQA